MSSKLLKSGIIVSTMTLISRVLGLLRDVVIANLMGANAAADVFFFANKIPNFLRRLFVEGAFAQAFIPVLTEVQQQGSDAETKRFLAKVSGTLGVVVTLVTILGVLASPVLAALFGTGWFLDHWHGEPGGEKFVLASLMLKITFPYLLFITLTGLAGAILNTLNRFAVSSFTPVLLNMAIIGSALYLSPHLHQPAIGLAWGVFIGGAVQLIFQLPFLWRAGLLVKPKWGWHDPNVVKIRTLMIPALFGVSVGQINLLLDTVIASFLGTGPISWLYYSDRLLEFPLGLFGIAIATVILPTLSRNHVNEDPRAFAANIDWGVRMVCLLGIPAAAGLFVLAEPIILVIFQRGAFSLNTAAMASYSLMAYVCGLLSFMLVKVLAPGYFSRQDTKTPVKFGIVAMVANMLFNLILVFPFGYVGLAMATAMSATLNAILLYIPLHQTGVYKVSGQTMRFVARIALATGAMVAVLWHFGVDVSTWREMTFGQRLWLLAQSILGGGGIFFVALVVLGGRPSHLRSWA